MAQSSSEGTGAQLTDKSGAASLGPTDGPEAANRAGVACMELEGWETGLPPAALR